MSGVVGAYLLRLCARRIPVARRRRVRGSSSVTRPPAATTPTSTWVPVGGREPRHFHSDEESTQAPPASRQVGTLRVESRGGGHPPVSTLGTRDSADTWRPPNGGGPAVLPGELRSPRGPAFATAVAPRPRSSKANPATPRVLLATCVSFANPATPVPTVAEQPVLPDAVRHAQLLCDDRGPRPSFPTAVCALAAPASPINTRCGARAGA